MREEIRMWLYFFTKPVLQRQFHEHSLQSLKKLFFFCLIGGVNFPHFEILKSLSRSFPLLGNNIPFNSC